MKGPYSTGSRDPTTGWSADRASGTQPPGGVALHVHQDVLDRLTADEAAIAVNEAALALINLGGWADYTPTLTQSASVPKTVNYAKYVRVGRLIIAQTFLTVSGAGGIAANSVVVGVPIAPAFTSVPQEVGTGTVFDTSTGQAWKGQAIWASATEVFFRASGSSTGVLGGTDFTAALATGDQVSMTVSYEAAS